jgi:hypothetical protein
VVKAKALNTMQKEINSLKYIALLRGINVGGNFEE